MVPMTKSEGEHSRLHKEMDHSRMGMSKMDHSKMKYDNAPMGMEGHDHHKMMINDFKKRFYITLILTVPIMLLSPMIQHWLHIQFRFTGSAYVLMSLSSVVFFYGGWPFLIGLIQEVKEKSLGMTLIGFAITVAYLYSVAILSARVGVLHLTTKIF